MTPSRSTRRRLAASSAVAVAALVATACGGGNGNDKKDASDSLKYNAATAGVVNASTAKGGTLKYVGTQDADSWDPQRGYYGFMWDFARYYTRQLVTYDTKPGLASTRLMPDLATDTAQVSDGGKTYKYTLRDGLTWEDGSPLTSKDIKYGIERAWAQDVVSGGPIYLVQVLDPKNEYKGPFKDKDPNKLGLKAIETPDDKTIIFHLPKANGDFEQMLAMPSGSPVKASEDSGAKYGLHPFSSGPYKFQSYSPNKSMVLVRNPKWNKVSDPIRPALPDKVTVTFLTNADDMDNRLIKGDFDIDINATGMGQAGRAKALRDPALKKNLDNPSTGFIRYAVFPQTVTPMNNIHCRKATIYAADKKSLQTARGGPLAGGDIAPNMLPLNVKGSDAKYDPYGALSGKPDIAKAKEELKACGKPNGFSTTIAVRNNKPAEVATAESLQESLKAVGINTQIDQFDGAQTTGIIGAPNVVKKNNYGIIIMGWGADFPTGQGFSQPLVDGRFILDNGNNNYSELNDPAINKLFDKALAETDAEKAGDIYQQMNEKVSEAAVYLPFVFEKNIIWRSSRLTNIYTADSYNGRYDYASMGVAAAK